MREATQSQATPSAAAQAAQNPSEEGGQSTERRLFDTVIDLARERKLLTAAGRQRNDSEHVIGAVHAMARIERNR